MSASGVNVGNTSSSSGREPTYKRLQQVLRYSALAFGVFYGFYHQSSLLAQQKLNEINREYQAKESLIAKAKAEYTKKTMPQESKTEGGGIITDPNDSKFDLEAYLTMKQADQAK